MSRYVDGAVERAEAAERGEPRLPRDRRALAELRAIVGETDVER